MTAIDELIEECEGRILNLLSIWECEGTYANLKKLITAARAELEGNG